jgi:DNA-binding NarL/FixJ family response regulator
MRAALGAREAVPGLPLLVLSQYVEESYAAELLSGGAGGVGYLLKERVADVADFVDAVRLVAGGGTAIDPDVIAQLLARGRKNPLDKLTARESEVLGLMAQGLSNTAVANSLVVSPGAVEKHIGNIFSKLGSRRARKSTAASGLYSPTSGAPDFERQRAFAGCRRAPQCGVGRTERHWEACQPSPARPNAPGVDIWRISEHRNTG